MKEQKYYVGLDMGTNSVGWAVTDTDYNLLRAKGKDLWGIREFEEAQTSSGRRTKRVARRRRQRQQVMMGLVRSYFADEIAKIDPNFFHRLDNSFYHMEDKDENARVKYVLFNDPAYNDIDYYKEYPTVFHLRKALIDDTAKNDIRLLYLAISNMFKHRGHFLNANLDSDSAYIPMREALSVLDDTFRTLNFEEIPCLSDHADMIEEVLCDRKKSKTQKVEKIYSILNINKKDDFAEYIRVICGSKSNTDKLFGKMSEDSEKKDICFSASGYEDSIPDIETAVGKEYMELLDSMKQVYDCGILGEILNGYKYLSYARVALYEKHQEDLHILKSVLKKYEKYKEYNLLFREESEGSYSSYIGSFYSSNKKQRRGMKQRSKEDFYKSVKKIIEPIYKTNPEDNNLKKILDDIANEIFMPKQLTSSNGVIPNQVHAVELKAILHNAEKHFPFLAEKDESNLTVSERIIELFSFQIPYYVGPTSELSHLNHGNGWVVRKEQGPVRPWNINEKIDMKATNEAFIKRLVRECTYISGEKVLPKNSILYQRYAVLNEINNICIDGERIDVALKQDIFNDLFLNGNRVTRNKLVKYLINRGFITEDSQITGIDININNSMSVYGRFHTLFGDKMSTDEYKRIIEEIIYWCTVYGDAKKYLKENLYEKFGDKLTPEQIKGILSMKFTDWGRLSREFLELSGCDKSTGEEVSLIGALWNTKMNMMELINSEQYSFKEELENKRDRILKELEDFKAEDLEEYYYSAPVKRMIWQTILIMKEIKKIMGCESEKIFVEMARSPEDKPQRKDSRKKKFIELYESVKNEVPEWKKFIELIEKEDASGLLKSKKLYLYLTQMGRDMYTGDAIDFDKLFTDNQYDIDHIYPRHFVKDDNLDNNLVLVYKPKNSAKQDNYPIDDSIRQKQYGFWSMLREKGFINEEKFKRLTGRNKFTDEQLAGFIARQMVETHQGTKGVAELLGQLMKDSRIVYAKARNVSDFRNKFDLPKSRLVNDFHHANDAYLNIVVGNAYDVKFTQNPIRFIKEEFRSNKSDYHLGRMFEKDIVRNGVIAWVAAKENGETGTIATVKKVMSRNTPLLTRLSFTGHGQIYDETLYGHNDAKKGVYIPFKTSDRRLKNVERYGGFNKASVAYFFLVEYEKKGKKERALESVPIYLKDIILSESDLVKYCKEVLKLCNPDIRIAKIKLQSLIEKNGYIFHITGKTGDRLATRNATPLYLDHYSVKYVHKLEKYNNTKILDETISENGNLKLYNLLVKKHNEGTFSNRLNQVGEKLQKGREGFLKLSLSEQCEVLYQVLLLSIIGKAEADLTLIGEAKKSGVMLISKKISGEDPVYLINQSITGIYEEKISLATV